jgi:hypothetical protein
VRAAPPVIGETGINVRFRPPGPGATTVDLGPVDRPAAIDLTINRDSQAYRDALDALERPRVAPWQRPVGTDIATRQPFGPAVGRAGVRDRVIVADALFARTPPGDPVPRLLSGDSRVYERLAGFSTAPLGNPPPNQSPATWLAQTFPNGFEIDINGQRLMVVPLAP